MEKTGKHFAKEYGVKLPTISAEFVPEHKKPKSYATQYTSSATPEAKKSKVVSESTPSKYGYKTSEAVVEVSESPPDAPEWQPVPSIASAAATLTNAEDVENQGGLFEDEYVEGPDSDEAQAVDQAISELEAAENEIMELEAAENEIMEEAEEETEEFINPFLNEEGN